MSVFSPPRPVADRLISRSEGLSTPFLLIDLPQVRANLARLRAALDQPEIYYAVKANPHPAVLRALAAAGSGFEISSDGELALLAAAGIAAPLICSNPIKAPAFITRAAASGVAGFAVDSPDELRKIAAAAPGASVYVRLLVDNDGSEWPLTRKYGADPAGALALLVQARALGLRPRGTTFHVGSQCRVSASWEAALARTAAVWEAAGAQGLVLEWLSVGGGFPVQHTRPIPPLEEIGAVIRRTVAERFRSGVRLMVEPGRQIIGDAAILGATVIGQAGRGDQRWVYLDVGVFNGLMEAIEGFSYELSTDRPGPASPAVLAGPSCDSIDVIAEAASLPDLVPGDRVYVRNAGAYTLSYASHFNGWPPPTVHCLDSEDEAR